MTDGEPDPERLLREWEANNDRLQWVRANADRIEAVTGKSPPSRPHRLDGWLDDHKSATTRSLREAASGGAPDTGEE